MAKLKNQGDKDRQDFEFVKKFVTSCFTDQAKFSDQQERDSVEVKMLGWLIKKNHGPISALAYFANHSPVEVEKPGYPLECTLGMLYHAASRLPKESDVNPEELFMDAVASSATNDQDLGRIERALRRLPIRHRIVGDVDFKRLGLKEEEDPRVALAKSFAGAGGGPKTVDTRPFDVKDAERLLEGINHRYCEKRGIRSRAEVEGAPKAPRKHFKARVVGDPNKLPTPVFGFVPRQQTVRSLQAAELPVVPEEYIPVVTNLVKTAHLGEGEEALFEMLGKAKDFHVLEPMLLLMKEACHRAEIKHSSGKQVSDTQLFRSVLGVVLNTDATQQALGAKEPEKVSPKRKQIRDEHADTVRREVSMMGRKDYFTARAGCVYLVPPNTITDLQKARQQSEMEGNFWRYGTLFGTPSAEKLYYLMVLVGDDARNAAAKSGVTVFEELQKRMQPVFKTHNWPQVYHIVRDLSQFGGVFKVMSDRMTAELQQKAEGGGSGEPTEKKK
ncbi:MAG: hypothetical protein ABH851_01865 [Methanobacteriota archaeon]